jgi:hypothetical protein
MARLRNLPFQDRKAALARLLRETEAGTLFNEYIAEDGRTVFAMRAGLAPRASSQSGWTAPIDLARAAWIKVRNPASIAVQRERSEIWNR